jgi:hypothetical protein
VQPFIHPELGEATHQIRELVALLQPRKKRPVYFCLRSYIAWLESAMGDIQAEAGPAQAVMVRRLSAPIKKPVLTPIPKINGNTEPTTTYYERLREEVKSR